jgi:hypothetical protein
MTRQIKRLVRKKDASRAAGFVDATVLIPVAAVPLPIHRVADQGAGDGTDRTTDNGVSHIIAARQRSERCATGTADHGASLSIRTTN